MKLVRGIIDLRGGEGQGADCSSHLCNPTGRANSIWAR